MRTLQMLDDLTAIANDRGGHLCLSDIYIVEAEGLGRFKIGMAVDAAVRIATLQTGCPVKLVPILVARLPSKIVPTVEARLHAKFSAQRLVGEWFALTADDLDRLPSEIRRASARHVNVALSELAALPDATARQVRRARIDTRIRDAKAAAAIPTRELVVAALEKGEASPAKLARIIDRKPRDTHEAIRGLIAEGVVAVIDPMTNEEGSVVHFDSYRGGEVMLTSAACVSMPSSIGLNVYVYAENVRIVTAQ